MPALKRYFKYFLPALLCVALFGGTVFYYILPQTEAALLNEKRQMVKELTNTVCSMLWSYDAQVQSGVLSLEEAQNRAINRISSLRYGHESKDYFWINDLHPFMIMHPYQPNLNGQDLTNYTDPNGVRLFVEMVKACQKNGQGWVHYSWQWKDDPTHILPKISYVHLFEPWSWIVGTGIYYKDIQDQVDVWAERLFITGIMVFVALMLVSGYLAYRSLRADRQAEETMRALKNSEQKFASVFREFPGWVVLSTIEDGVYLDVNDTFLELTGYKREEIIGNSSVSLGTWVDPEQRELALRLLNEQGYVRNQEVKRRVASGQELDMLFSCERIDIDGRQCILSISLDISDRKEAERTIRRQEQQMRAILDAVGETMVLIDRQGTVLTANQTVCRRLGVAKHDLVGRCIYDFFPPDVAGYRRSKYVEVLTSGRSLAFEDQREGRTFEQNVYPLFGEKGQAEAAVIFARDITERKKADEARSKLEAQLRQAQKMEAIGTLAGGKPVTRHLEQILKSAERARDLVKQILAFSRRSETNLQPLDINQVVMQSVKMLGHTIPKMIDLKMNLAGNLGTVLADAGQLEQVIMNLASNAKDAMPEGGRLIFETSLICLDQEFSRAHLEITPGWYVVLSVTDTGQGMDKETLNQIYDPFFTTKDIGKGTGLGLASVYGTVKENHGHITCYSEPGRGTTFKIYLPSMRQEASAVEECPPDSFHEIQGGKETLLVVDDEESLRDIARSALQDAGYQVLEAASGEEALSVYGKKSRDIDLVILDIGMPGMGGHQCLKQLMEIRPGAKIIIASGYSKNGTIKSAFDEGAKGYVAKPFGRAELMKAVRQVLDA